VSPPFRRPSKGYEQLSAPPSRWRPHRRPVHHQDPAGPGYTLDDDDSPGQATIAGRPVEPDVAAVGGGWRVESYYRNGLRHDPDDGRPAVVWYRPDGTVWSEEHHRDGLRHDPDDGRPAVVGYHPDGTVEYEYHYSDGQYHDPDDGSPASVDYYPDGTVKTAEHWQRGVRQD